MYLRLLKDASLSGTKGACFYAANLLSELACKFLRLESAVCGGDGAQDGGYFDAQGRGFGHYWAEVVDGQANHWVLDITADQFGDAPVVILLAADARDKYRLGSRALIDAQIHENWTEVFYPAGLAPLT
jgi:hypothetical protein